MCLLLPLITPGNDEHGRTIGSSDTHDTQSNTGRGSRLARGLRSSSFRAGITEHIGVSSSSGSGRIRPISCRCSTVLGVRADDDVNGRVDLRRKVADELVRRSVQSRIGGPDVHAQGVDHVAGVGEQRECRHIAHRCLGVEWNQLLHLRL